MRLVYIIISACIHGMGEDVVILECIGTYWYSVVCETRPLRINCSRKLA